MGPREDVGYDDEGVDVSIGVRVDAVAGVGVNDQGLVINFSYLSRCQSRCRSMCRSSCRFSPPHFPRLLGSPSEIWGSYECLILSTSPRNGYLD